MDEGLGALMSGSHGLWVDEPGLEQELFLDINILPAEVT